MKRTAVLVLFVSLAVAAGCSPSAAPAQSPTTEATQPPGLPARITVTLTDALTMEPALMSAPGGVPVTFIVTNSGAIEHEFYIGDADAQAEHESAMQSTGGMMHDEPNGIALEPGETKELTTTFAEAGETIAGCHVPGHYPGGMRATISIV